MVRFIFPHVSNPKLSNIICMIFGILHHKVKSHFGMYLCTLSLLYMKPKSSLISFTYKTGTYNEIWNPTVTSAVLFVYARKET
jgi:hypothetical protein